MNRTTGARIGGLLLAGSLVLGACSSESTTSSGPGTSAGTGGTTPGSTPGSTPGTVAGQPAFASDLDADIPTVMQENAIPGAIIFVSSPEGDYKMTFGTAEIGTETPPSIEDFWRIGSNTKTMTVTVIMQLVQEGKLALDDPISKFRPDVPDGENITIAQLAEMRSGLYSYTFDEGFNATLDAEPQKAWTPDELLAIGFSHPNTAPPGTEFEYSNTNLVLLGVVIEELTGMSAREAFQERIFEPLGMDGSQLPEADDSSLPEPHPQGYQFGNNVQTIESYAVPADQLQDALDGTLLPLDETDANPSWAWTAGGAISTLDDLTTYVRAMVGGGLLDEETQQTRMDSIQPMNPASPTIGYGLGIARFGSFYGHDGQLPGFSSMMVYDPESETSVILFTNLSAVPSTGENAAVVVFKEAIAPALGAAAAGGSPSASPGGTTPGTTAG